MDGWMDGWKTGWIARWMDRGESGALIRPRRGSEAGRANKAPVRAGPRKACAPPGRSRRCGRREGAARKGRRCSRASSRGAQASAASSGCGWWEWSESRLSQGKPRGRRGWSALVSRSRRPARGLCECVRVVCVWNSNSVDRGAGNRRGPPGRGGVGASAGKPSARCRARGASLSPQ
jgi:hypothetical protein